MKSTDFVTALATLLSQPDLQDLFAQNPNRVANQLNLADHDRAMFSALLPKQINIQANLLITKRMKEVHKFLPQTFKLLDNNIAAFFKSYAITFWPHSHQRHVEDAYQFCNYLKLGDYPVNQSELNQLAFKISGRRVSLALAGDALIKGHHILALQLFYRLKGSTGQWRLYFKG